MLDKVNFVKRIMYTSVLEVWDSRSKIVYTPLMHFLMIKTNKGLLKYLLPIRCIPMLCDEFRCFHMGNQAVQKTTGVLLIYMVGSKNTPRDCFFAYHDAFKNGLP